MNRAEAVEFLTDTSSHRRLKAARLLANVGSPQDLPLLRRRLGEEPVSFVRRALEQAIERIKTGRTADPVASTESVDSPEDVERVAYTRAVEWVTTSLLHEISPHLGVIKLEARRAVDNYDVSPLKSRIDSLDAVLKGIEELRRATVSEERSEIRLYSLVEEVAREEARGKPLPVSIQGSKELTVVVDPNLLRLAVSNGIRNALEATAASGWSSPVIVSFGATDYEYWISVLDSGPGITGPTEAAFAFGRTTKSGHRGFGLALARQALMTLDGTVTLQPAQTGGARLDMVWFQ